MSFVRENNDPRVVITGLGNKFLPPVFQLLKGGTTLDTNYEDSIELDDLDVNLDHKETIINKMKYPLEESYCSEISSFNPFIIFM